MRAAETLDKTTAGLLHDRARDIRGVDAAAFSTLYLRVCLALGPGAEGCSVVATVEPLVRSRASAGNIVRLAILPEGEPHVAPCVKAQGEQPPCPTLNFNAADARLAIAPSDDGGHRAFAAFVMLSLLAHLTLYAALNSRPPPSMASIGEEVISIEIVVGSNSAAGLAETAEPTVVENPIAAEPTKPEEPKEQRAAETQTPEQAPASETAMARLEPEPEDTPAPTERDDPVVEPVRPQVPTVPSSGIGHGTSAPDARYYGRIAAHLARRKQYPPEARSKRQQGTGTVKFTIDATGQVSAIHLIRRTGFPALDSEIEAMVRRAAPFPPPPGGASVSFAAPVSFRIN
jgi:periplasmic protein TonB